MNGSEQTHAPDREMLATALKAAMRQMPGPVALVSTRDPRTDQPAGLVASAVIPVSMNPPSMLVAVNRNGSGHGAIERAGRFCINLLSTGQTALVQTFSDPARREARFASQEWAARDGMPYLPAARASIFCVTRPTLIFGTHELFIGEVEGIEGDQTTADDPLGWIAGDFARLAPLG